MKLRMVIYPLRWMLIIVLRLLEVVGMTLLIFVVGLAGLIAVSEEPEPQEWRGHEDDK